MNPAPVFPSRGEAKTAFWRWMGALLIGLATPWVATAELGSRCQAAAAAEGEASRGEPTPCADGVVYDDGSTETGWGWVPSAIQGQYVQEFSGADLPTRELEKICICFLRTSVDADIDFDVVFYRDEDGRPAREPFATIPAQGLGIPQGVANATFIEVPLPGVEVPVGTFYAGPRWNPSVDRFFFVCADTTPTSPLTDLWFIDDRAEDWDSALTTEDPLFQFHRSVLIRPVASGTVPIELPLGFTATALLAVCLACAGFYLLWRP